MQRNVVVLPQPLGPSSVKSWPLSTANEIRCSARTSPLQAGKFSGRITHRNHYGLFRVQCRTTRQFQRARIDAK